LCIRNPVKDFRTLCGGGGGGGGVGTTVSPMKVFRKKTRQPRRTISMALAVQSAP